jgi:hypothetical protein
MTMQESVFEAPAAHEASHYGNPYSSQEHLESEWETPEAYPYGVTEAHPYGNPYASTEWEMPEANRYGSPESHPYSVEAHPEWESPEAHPYGNPYASTEWETPEAHPYSLEAQPEWETPETHPYGSPYASTEWELPEAHSYSPELEDYASTEWEDEGELFFKRAFSRLKSFANRLAPFGKLLTPLAAKALGSMIPGLGVIAGPLAGQLARQLVREGELEALELEAQLFGTNESEAEVGNTEAAHEAALTELLANEAAQAESEAEAEALLGGTLPITITIMGGRRALRPVMPTLAQANGRLVRVLRRQGPAGRQLLRTLPTIQRQAVAILRAAARRGRPINGPLVVRALTAATQNVLGNPRQVQRAVERNAVLRSRVAPPSPRRAAVFVPGRVPPPHPRRAAGYQPMRATPRRTGF